MTYIYTLKGRCHLLWQFHLRTCATRPVSSRQLPSLQVLKGDEVANSGPFGELGISISAWYLWYLWQMMMKLLPPQIKTTGKNWTTPNKSKVVLSLMAWFLCGFSSIPPGKGWGKLQLFVCWSLPPSCMWTLCSASWAILNRAEAWQHIGQVPYFLCWKSSIHPFNNIFFNMMIFCDTDTADLYLGFGNKIGKMRAGKGRMQIWKTRVVHGFSLHSIQILQSLFIWDVHMFLAKKFLHQNSHSNMRKSWHTHTQTLGQHPTWNSDQIHPNSMDVVIPNPLRLCRFLLAPVYSTLARHKMLQQMDLPVLLGQVVEGSYWEVHDPHWKA